MNITEASAGKALLIVDVQNDFCPGGSLPVPGGNEIIEPINKMIGYAKRNVWQIIATRDWHPARTKHFKDFGGIWPSHCVQNTEGAKFHPDLRMSDDIIVVSKGMGDEDAYSPFDSKVGDYSLEKFLKMSASREIYVCGLALDYCVKAAALDAIKKGFKVTLIHDATKAVNINPEDGQNALKEIAQAGALIDYVSLITV